MYKNISAAREKKIVYITTNEKMRIECILFASSVYKIIIIQERRNHVMRTQRKIHMSIACKGVINRFLDGKYTKIQFANDLYETCDILALVQFNEDPTSIFAITRQCNNAIIPAHCNGDAIICEETFLDKHATFSRIPLKYGMITSRNILKYNKCMAKYASKKMHISAVILQDGTTWYIDNDNKIDKNTVVV